MKMRTKILYLASVIAIWSAPVLSKEIMSVDTTWNAFGENDKVVVERFDDPRVNNVSCYVSYAKSGGISGAIGLSEDPSRFSIACRAVGPVTLKSDVPVKNEEVFNRNASTFFKKMHITRNIDNEKNVLVYIATSDRLIDGSPFNSISVVPIQ